MAFSGGSLTQLLNDNVCEVVFVRRGDGNFRRMLCTNSKVLLNSISGAVALGFNPPKGVGLKYDPAQKGLVVTWDIMWQEFRQINLESVNVISAIPVTNDEELKNFWLFFDKKLQRMSSFEKTSFMRK